jgi:hypothetical protein
MDGALLSANGYELGIASLWTFVLILCRLIALLNLLPGVGTDEVPIQIRFYLAFSIIKKYKKKKKENRKKKV